LWTYNPYLHKDIGILGKLEHIHITVGVCYLHARWFFCCTSPLCVYVSKNPSSDQLFKNALIIVTNRDREAQGAPQLFAGTLLSVAAQEKADDMAFNSYFEHVSPSGKTPWYWFTSVGYYYTRAAENLAMNFDTPGNLEAAWMASPTHRVNIIRNSYTQIGIGIAHGTYLGKPATYIVEFFAKPIKSYL